MVRNRCFFCSSLRRSNLRECLLDVCLAFVSPLLASCKQVELVDCKLLSVSCCLWALSMLVLSEVLSCCEVALCSWMVVKSKLGRRSRCALVHCMKGLASLFHTVVLLLCGALNCSFCQYVLSCQLAGILYCHGALCVPLLCMSFHRWSFRILCIPFKLLTAVLNNRCILPSFVLLPTLLLISTNVGP